MTRSATAIVFHATVVLLCSVVGASACAKPADREAQGAADATPVRHGAVVGEEDDEVVAQPAQSGHLGGPFQPPPQSVPDPQRATPEPASSKTVEDMSDAELVTYLNTLVWDMSLDHGELVLLPCKKPNNAACPFQDYSQLYIQPEVGANILDVSTISEKGVVVARLINYSVGPDGAADLDLPASERGWWYVHKSGNKLRSRFFIRTYGKTDKGAKFVGANREFKGCENHPNDRTRPAIAKWRSCADNGGIGRMASPRPARKVMSLLDAVRLQADSSQDSTGTRRPPKAETWITCSLGCCVGG